MFAAWFRMQKFVAELLRSWHLSAYVWNLVLVAGSVVAGLLLSWLISLFIKKQSGAEIRFRFGQSLLRHLFAPSSLLWPLLIFNALIPLLRMRSSFRNRIDDGVEIGLIIGFAWLAVRFLRVGQDIVRDKININVANNLRQRQIVTQLMYVRRVLTFFIVIVATGAVLLTFDTMRKVGTGLLTGVGIGGIIVGFAAQNSLANLLAGLQIAFTQPIRIDDEVIVEGEFGFIEELTLTYVVVRIWDQRRLVLPINYFLTRPFQNWTRTTSNIIGSVYLYADYSLPVDWLRSEFLEIVNKHPLWDKVTAGLVVTDLKADVMELRGIVSTRSSGDAWNLRCHIREQLIKRINARYPECLPRTRAALVRETHANGGDKPLSPAPALQQVLR